MRLKMKLKFCCSRTVVTFHRIYLQLTSVGFLRFQSLHHFMKSQFGVKSSFFYEIIFFGNHIFNDKTKMLLEFVLNWLSHVSFFLRLCLTSFIAYITLITSLLYQIYVCTTSYELSNVPSLKWWHEQKGKHILKIYIINVTKLIFKVTLCHFHFKLNKYWQNRKGVLMPPTQPNLSGLKKGQPQKSP